MSKFKVGDRVTATEFSPKGMTGTIIYDDGTDCGLLVEFDEAFNAGHDGDGRGKRGRCLFCFAKYLEPAGRHKILITTDGTTTLARLYEGNKVVKSAEAKCAPSDTFDFAVGANLAYDRLMRPDRLAKTKPAEKPKDKPAEPKAEPVKLYCVKDCNPKACGCVKKGKIYEQDEQGFIHGENGLCTAESRIRDGHLLPLVKRPAEVGEWVYIVNRMYDTRNTYSKGDICQVVQEEGFGAFIKTQTGKTHNCNIGDGTAFVYHEEYLVLDGFRG